MSLAIEEAKLASRRLEVPVGAVLVRASTGEVLAMHHNTVDEEDDPTAHAELKCIRDGAKRLGGWRYLAETTLYVTLEPCPMCAGAVLNARLGEVVWGAPNPLIGGDGSWLPIMGDGGGADVAEADVDEPEDAVRSCSIPGGGGPVRPHAFKPTLVVRRRVLEEECAALMRSFFRERRDASKAAREVARAEAEDADPPRTSS